MSLLFGLVRSLFVSREVFENLELRRKYMMRRQPRGDGQTWRTFIKNHGHELLACDFMTLYGALFATVYVFIMMEVSTRRVAHFNVTSNPTLDWVKNRIRDVVAFDRKPRFLLHDNDGIFGQFGVVEYCNRARPSQATHAIPDP
jgi:hypothetical protein